MENVKKEKIKKVAGICANVLIWIFVLISLLVTILVFSAQGSEDGIPAIFGKSLITIESPSMEPTYGVNDLVFMTKLDDEGKAALKKGDIVTYYAPVNIDNDSSTIDINTHRIYEIDHASKTIKTKGDNEVTNPTEDNYTITYNDVIGQCTEDGKLAGVGGAIKFLRSSLGFFLCIVLPLALFFFYELYRFISLIVSERAKRAPVSAETEEEIKRRAIEEYLASQKAETEKKEVTEEGKEEASEQEKEKEE